MPWKVTFEIVTDPTVFHIVRKSIAAAAIAEGMSGDAASEIEVAVGEALSNAYIHAYGREAGPLKIELHFDGESVTILIRDHGKPLTDRPTIPNILPPRGDGSGGRGLYIIGRMMDEAEVLDPGPQGDGTAIRMAKRIR